MNNFRTKVPMWAHQQKGDSLAGLRDAFAWHMEQGTGKTHLAITNAGKAYAAGKIEALLITAPNGVQRAWLRDQLPAYASPQVPYLAANLTAPSKRRKADERALDAVMTARVAGLRVMAVNYEAMLVKAVAAQVKQFLRTFDTMWILDESHRIKNPKAGAAEVILDLSVHAKMRRVMTGTPNAESPLDLYGPMRFLDDEILGYQSFVAFRAHFAQLESDTSTTAIRIRQKLNDKYGRERAGHMMPQLLARGQDGRPIFRNLDELRELIAPHCYRVLKSECMDLPEKVYCKRYVTLAPEQRRIYNELRDEYIVEFQERQLTATMTLPRLMRLAQITGGFMPSDDDAEARAIVPTMDNPKIEAVLDIVGEADAKVIIWARFHNELDALVEALEDAYGEGSTAQYHGRINDKLRDENKARYINDPQCRFFVAQQRAGGTGVDGLQAVTEVMIFFSNDFPLTTRLQAEDRAHRGGMRGSLTIYDLEAEETVDRKIINTLRAKKNISDELTGDPPGNWI